MKKGLGYFYGNMVSGRVALLNACAADAVTAS